MPQQMAWVVERFGRFDMVLEPGLRFLLPFVQRVSYTFSLKEEAISVPSQVCDVTQPDRCVARVAGTSLSERLRAMSPPACRAPAAAQPPRTPVHA